MNSVGIETGRARNQASRYIISEYISCILGDYCIVICVSEDIPKRGLFSTGRVLNEGNGHSEYYGCDERVIDLNDICSWGSAWVSRRRCISVCTCVCSSCIEGKHWWGKRYLNEGLIAVDGPDDRICDGELVNSVSVDCFTYRVDTDGGLSKGDRK